MLGFLSFSKFTMDVFLSIRCWCWRGESGLSYCLLTWKNWLILCCLKFAGDPLTQPPAPVRAWNSRKNQRQILERNGLFVCGICQKSYKSKGCCYGHYQIHIRNTTCKICKKILGTKQALRRHMDKHRGTIRCENCNKTFSCLTVLKRHQLTSQCAKNHAQKSKWTILNLFIVS